MPRVKWASKRPPKRMSLQAPQVGLWPAALARTMSRWVISSLASNWATVDLRISLPIDGRMRSS